jgi:hypothetical protein
MMAGIPSSLSIALWVVGSTWVIALLAYLMDMPGEIVLATFGLGLVTGIAEWMARRLNRH